MTERSFKVVIIGDPKAGKTSFMKRYVGHRFDSNYKATLGCDFAEKKIRKSRTELVRLYLWDIGGQDAFRCSTRVFYRSAAAAIIMFDITSRLSFEHVVEWKRDLESKVVLPDDSPVPCMLIANKTDLGNHVVSDEEITAMSQDQQFVGWSKISVKDYINVEKPMLFLVDEILARCPKSQVPAPSPTRAVKLSSKGQGPKVKDFTASLNSEFLESVQLHQESQRLQQCFCFY